MAGLIGLGHQYRQQAVQGLHQAARMEQDRDQQHEANKQARKAQTLNLAGQGAAMGFMAGKAGMLGGVAGPMGAVLGAGLGLVLGRLF